MPNQDVIRQDAANAEAQRKFQAERARTNKIHAAAKDLRQKGADLHKTNTAIRKSVAAFKEIANADLLELRATNEGLAVEQAELLKKVAMLESIAGIA